MKQPFHLGGWYVEPDRHRISRGAESAHLQPKMMAVLQVLVEREGQTVEKNELLDLVWPRQYVNEEVLKRVILKLRQVLGDDSRKPVYIETIHRKGYRLLCSVRIAETPTQDSMHEWPGGSPFRSLNHFEPADSHLFFGRSTAVAEARVALAEQCERKRGFLLISGASGAGKSSFARAGLIPALLQERGLDFADISILRPADLFDVPQDSCLGRIMASLDTEQVEHARTGQAVPLLLIDQFEETLALEKCAAIMDLVHTLARSGRLDVIVTMRDDFMPALNDWPVILRLKQGAGTFTLGRPSQSELAEILHGPAQLAGFRYEISDRYGSLKREIISTANKVRQALPLLQFLLHRMYEERDDETLTWASYHRLGGLVGAISKHADEVMSKLGKPLTAALPGLLEQLTRFDLERQCIIRHPARMSKIATDPKRERLALALVNARLLTSDTSADGHHRLSLVHESLLEHWELARAWSDENLLRLAAYRRTQLAFGNWKQGGKPADLLLRAGKAMGDGKFVASLAGLDEDIRDFIAQSYTRVARRNKIRRAAVTLLAVLTITSVGAFYLANQQRQAAERSLDLANRTTDFVIGLFNTTRPNTSAESLTARELLDEGVRRIPLEFAQDNANRARLLHATGRLYMQMGELDRAEELLTLALQAAGDAQREKYEYAWTLAELRDIRNRDIADQREDELLKLALASLVASGAQDEEIAAAYWRAARLVMPEWRYSPYYWERAYEYYASKAFADNPETPKMLTQFAVVLAYWRYRPVKLRDTDRALQMLAQSLALFQAQDRVTSPTYYKTLETAASLEYSFGSVTLGIERQRSAAVGSLNTLGRQHIATPFRWQVLGDYLLEQGFYTEANLVLQQAAEMYLESYGSETPRWYETSLSLADAWFYSGRHEEAGKLLDVLDIRQKQAWGMVDHPETWRLWQLRGHLARSAGDLAAAGTAYQRALGLIGRIAAQGDLVRQMISVELDYLSVKESTGFSDFTKTYLGNENNWIRYSKQSYQGDSLRPNTDMLVKLLHIGCETPYAAQAAQSLQLLVESTWEIDAWQQHAATNELARCDYLQLDPDQLRDNAKAIARLTHPSTFMAIEAFEILNQQAEKSVTFATP